MSPKLRRSNPSGIAPLVLALVLVGCTVKTKSGPATTAATGTTETTLAFRKGDVIVDVAVSSEKVSLLTELAKSFNDDASTSTITDEAGGKRRVTVRIQKKASGAAATALVNGWSEAEEGPQPVIWSPSARAWGAIANQRLSEKGQPAIAPVDATSFMLTPLVIAMPKPMADALGYPKTPIGFADLNALSKDPAGWGAKGHPEWGPFKLGKTNPNFSTSGLSATIAMYYAATGKTTGLTLEDLNKAEVRQYASDVEASVVHYGDITMTFLNNWFRTDARGTSLTYASAVAIEEKSLIDYNAGNPDGILDTGEVPRKPRVPLVAIYPKNGTLLSDNPLFILDASWVDANERLGAKAFEKFVLEPDNQRKVLQFGFRPGNPSVAVGDPITLANGVDPNEPKTALDVPDPKVLTKVLDLWAEQRKKARVLLVIDVSGSMGDFADGNGASSQDTKLDLAKRAAVHALDEFQPQDQVGLRIFTTNADGKNGNYVDLVPIADMGANREAIARKIDELVPMEGTPLYATAQASLDDMRASIDPTRITAVVFLTDGVNEDGTPGDDADQLAALVKSGRNSSEAKSAAIVRIFPIAYGTGADLATLKRIAEATTATAYDASDPKTIEKVFTNVVSNF